MNKEQRIQEHFDSATATIQATRNALSTAIAEAANAMSSALDNGNKLLICGNGGSASDALHFSGELLCRFERDRRALPAIALPADTATLTATGNDYDFSQVFARQVEAFGQPGDLLVAITTSGNSENIRQAVTAAKAAGVGVIALTGRNGGQLAEELDANHLELRVPDTSTARIQESHAIIIHCLCDLIELHVTENSG